MIFQVGPVESAESLPTQSRIWKGGHDTNCRRPVHDLRLPLNADFLSNQGHDWRDVVPTGVCCRTHCHHHLRNSKVRTNEQSQSATAISIQTHLSLNICFMRSVNVCTEIYVHVYCLCVCCIHVCGYSCARLSSLYITTTMASNHASAHLIK